MPDDDKLRDQLASIGVRYLTRTLGELNRINELASQIESGSSSALKDLEHAAHKIHGSGAMFGFQELSDHASTVEKIAGHLADGDGPEPLRALGRDELRRRLAASVIELGEVTRRTAAELGIEPNAG